MCFHPDRMTGLGLGADNSAHSVKDCGYSFAITVDGLVFGGGGPFRNVRRYRCVNNYWIWIMVEWGQWVLGLPPRMGLTSYPGDVHRPGMTAEQQYHVTVLSRAHNSLGLLVRWLGQHDCTRRSRREGDLVVRRAGKDDRARTDVTQPCDAWSLSLFVDCVTAAGVGPSIG